MSNQWLRLWHDMPTDPKWRTIARISKQRISDVIAVYVHILVTASNAVKRGNVTGCNNEDVASALDLETDQVKAIREAMQGRVMEGEYLTGWDKRQPKREDNSSERVRAYRESKKHHETHNKQNETVCNDSVTQCNAPDTDTEKKEGREGVRASQVEAAPSPLEIKKSNRGSRLRADWELPQEWGEWAETQGLSGEEVLNEGAKFKDWWISKAGAGGVKADWEATWRNWIRRFLQDKSNAIQAKRYK